MKIKITYFLALFVLIISSCKKDSSNYSETIKKGNKWGLSIGSTPEMVYAQLQKLNQEKDIHSVSVVYRQSYTKPEELKNKLPFYNALTLEKASGQTDRIVIEFKEDKVSSIYTGGGLLNEVKEWPQNLPDDVTIHQNDLVATMYNKLVAIYQVNDYNQYKLTLPDKILTKAFDADMANYKEWAFEFAKNVGANVSGRSSVRLLFENGKLNKILHQYQENEFVID
ncbi:MAG: hypothetical protein ABIP95_00825 [Pelobium sp.]